MNIESNQCVVDTLLKYLSDHPCMHCGACVYGYEGITQLQMILKDITLKKGNPNDYELMYTLATLMQHQTACEKGAELSSIVLELLDKYKEDFMLHIQRKECRAGVCTSFMTFHVLASKCIGCHECVDVCEDDAILGRKRFIHVIDLDTCTQCGKCVNACSENAIVMAGRQKPKGPKKPIPIKR